VPGQIATRKGAGQLRHRVQLQSATVVTDSQGGRSQTWATYATVWGAVDPVPVVVSEEQSVVLFIVSIRYRSDVVKQQRVIAEGMTLKILELVNPEQRNRDLVLHCASVTT
jgi:SPP1 family predicted phage head-tail adaptor